MNAQTTIEAAAPAIGTPVESTGLGLAYIVAVEPETAAIFTIGGAPGGMAANRWKLTIANARGFSEISEHIAGPGIERARHLPPISEAEAAAIYAEARAARERAQEASRKAQSDTMARHDKNKAELLARAPAGAQAVIIAELMRDDSDSQSDYFNSYATRGIVLAYSMHKRDIFAEMRKAARLHPETAHLADAPDSAEHRHKHSMGAGYFLSIGGAYSDGWRVRKVDLGNAPQRFKLEFIEAAAPVPADRPAGAVSGGFSIEEHTHTKKGFQMFICTMAERVERGRYDQLLDAARALGGWYSRAWAGAPAGFAFKRREAAEQFAAEQGGQDQGGGGALALLPQGVKAPKPAAKAAANLSEKLRALADGMQSAIDDKFRDRPSNTPKRARQAAEARLEGSQYERAQKIARALADCHDAGTVPPCLAKVSTKGALLDLAKEEIDRARCGYYDAGFATGKPYDWRDAAKNEAGAAAWGLLVDDPAAREREALRQKIEGLQFAKIPGYFPTPRELVAQMIERARIAPGASVLEPSAGSGAIADALAEAGASVACFEKHSTLCDILRGKGHDVEQCDFMDMEPLSKVDAVLMNPPFENAQDVAHVLHAWEFVKPGGVLVAIMGAGVTFRQDRAYREFREFVDRQGGEMVSIPAGAFKESGTGVATVMVELWKEPGA